MIGSKQSLDVIIDSPHAYYTNGNTISGRVVLDLSRSQSVLNIEVKLRCEEYAYVWVPNGQGGNYVTETLRYLSLKHTVFPMKSLRYDPNTDPKARYTLQSGFHEFPFEFTIPVADRYPQSVTLPDSHSGIKWYVKAVVHKGQYMSTDKRAIRPFEMRPSYRLDYDGSILKQETESRAMIVYLPGYSTWIKTPSAKLKDIMPGCRILREKVHVKFTLFAPMQGILQSPFNLSLFLSLETDCDKASELIRVRGAKLELKQKIIVGVNQCRDTSTHRDSFELLTIPNLDEPLKQGLDKLETEILKLKIGGRLPSTLTSPHFEITYKLVLVLSIASTEKPSAVERIRISIPVDLRGFLPQGTVSEPEAGDDLPVYRVLPSYDEATVNPTVETPEYSRDEFAESTNKALETH